MSEAANNAAEAERLALDTVEFDRAPPALDRLLQTLAQGLRERPGTCDDVGLPSEQQ
jgi:hypothetical protein